MINCISFSGGRTSAFMCHLFKSGEVEGESVFIYNDTGAEHPKTYEFIRKCNESFNLNLISIKSVVSPEMGKSNNYEVVSTDALKWDLSVMKENNKKYGGFTNNRPYCTERMKTIIAKKYRDDHFGKKGAFNWLGIRYDEPKRLVGDHKQYDKSAYKQLVACGMEDYEISELFVEISKDVSALDCVRYFFIEDKTKQLLTKRIKLQKSLNLRYLAQISTATKQDILDWWSNQSFDLQITEHLGNCVFCIKKSELKVALAARDEPELFNDWCEMTHHESVRLMPADSFGKGRIYRKWMSPEMLIATFEDSSTENLRERVYKTKQFESGSCSESCEPYTELDQLHLFRDEAV